MASGVTSTLVTGCYHNRILQRSQLIIVPESILLALSGDSWRQITRQIPVSRNYSYNRLVNRVGTRIADSSGQSNVNWEFMVLDHRTPNAFVLPGGKVAFHSGILPLMQNEAQVAAVMGHEVGHVAGRHAQERLSQQLAINGLIMLASYLASGQMDQDMHRMVFAALGAGVTYGLLLPYSRQHEYEADKLGLHYMANSGYDPRDAGNFWRNMMRYSANRQRPLEFLSTHPSDANRLAAINKEVTGLLPTYERNYQNSNW
ncbi:hypothetical protein TI04_06225 [Achromatium sp. WMS2]|nr:hypothetical protein TI04_06225 [Achromatium sp. WMS2]